MLLFDAVVSRLGLKSCVVFVVEWPISDVHGLLTPSVGVAASNGDLHQLNFWYNRSLLQLNFWYNRSLLQLNAVNMVWSDCFLQRLNIFDH